MADPQQFFAKVLGPIRDLRYRREVEEELRNHMEEAVADLIAEGLSREEAWRQVQDAFGDPELLGMALQRVHHRGFPFPLLRERFQHRLGRLCRWLFGFGFVVGLGLADLAVGPILSWFRYDLATQPFPTVPYLVLRAAVCTSFLGLALWLDRVLYAGYDQRRATNC